MLVANLQTQNAQHYISTNLERFKVLRCHLFTM